MERPLILTGFMGAGKTAVARLAAGLLKVNFIDLDDHVEKTSGLTIAKLFENHGEPRFRELETKALEEIIQGPPVIIATGGGVLKTARNRELMKGCVAVNLDAGIETLLKRLSGTEYKRPLLKGGEEAVRRLYQERKPLYEAVPLHIDTEGKDALAVAREVTELVQGKGCGTCGAD